MKLHFAASMVLLLAVAFMIMPIHANLIERRSAPIFSRSDVLIPPDLPISYYSASSRALAPSLSQTPGYYETSEYLIGSVAVGIVFLESNGTIDQSTENWTPTLQSSVISEINGSGLHWLANYNPDAHVSFILDIHYKVPTSYEPINRPSTDEGLWISEAMTYLGYSGASYLTQTRDYINDLRNKLRTDWAFAIFVVGSYNDADGQFTDGKFAYAYLGGPFLVTTYKNDAWGITNMDNVVAHETLHIFYATDEYDGVSEFSGYLNVEDSEGAYCIMNPDASASPIWTICSATRGQIGWRDTDVDKIQDIVDTFSNTTLIAYSPDPTNDATPTYTGTATEIPYPNNNPKGSGKNVTINTIVSVKYRVDSGAWLDASATDGLFDEAEEEFTFTTPLLLSGKHSIEARAINSVGNIETSLAKDEVTVDILPPEVSIISPVSPYYTNLANLTVAWTSSDAISGVDHYEVWLNTTFMGDTGKLTTFSLSGIADGLYDLKVKAIDRAGNLGSSSIFLTVDTTPPLISITSPKNGSQVRTSTILITWNGSDAVSGIEHYEIRLDENPWINTETNRIFMFSKVSDGTHTLHIKAVDVLGNSQEVQIDFLINTSLIGGPGWVDDAIVFGAIGAVAVVAVGLFVKKRSKKRVQTTLEPYL